METTSLHEWMEQQGISDTQLGVALGCDRTLVFKVRKGQRPPSGEFKWRFMQVYGQPAAQIVFGPDTPA